MNDNAKRVVEALRSGKYEQGKRQLRPAEDEYCCLGVACDVFHEVTGRGEWVKEDDGYRFVVDDDSSDISLPDEVRDWIGFTKRPLSGFRSEGHFGTDSTLSTRNDGGATFAEIAKLIESEPEGLFA